MSSPTVASQQTVSVPAATVRSRTFLADRSYARGMTDEALSWIDKAVAKDPENEAFKERRAVMVEETAGK